MSFAHCSCANMDKNSETSCNIETRHERFCTDEILSASPREQEWNKHTVQYSKKCLSCPQQLNTFCLIRYRDEAGGGIVLLYSASLSGLLGVGTKCRDAHKMQENTPRFCDRFGDKVYNS